MKISSFSKEGKYYSNEDSLSVCQLESDKAIAILADGMGGFTFGKEAADLIVSTLASFICEHIDRISISELLHEALKYADDAIAGKAIEYHSKMGAAIALAFIDGNRIHYTWLGNVRIYLSHLNELKLLTSDHLLDVGYGKQLLTRCIKGCGLRDNVPYNCIEVKSGDILILSTDGFYKQHIDTDLLLNKDSYLLTDYEDDASMIRIDF